MRQKTTFLAAIILSLVAGGTLLAQGYNEDAAISRAFRSVLHRDPYPMELRRYRVLMDENGWREADVRRDLSQRTDYRRYSARGRSFQPDVVIRRAYQDILARDPDPEGLRSYRDKMIREGWSERDVREALRNSPEFASMDRRHASADRIIQRAYRDILGRDPDPSGMETYRRNIVENGWDEQDVRQALLRSPEYRRTHR
jgi:hypothetical protein